MSGETPAAPAAPAQTQPVNDRSGDVTKHGQGMPPTHHSARQPRDEAQRFAGPPGQETAPETPAAKAARLRLEYIEDGKPVVEELDDVQVRERLLAERNRRYLDKQATQKMQRASEIAKQAKAFEEVAQALATGDAKKIRAYFEQQKKDPKEALASVLESILAEEEMTPAEKELAAANARLAALEEEKRRGQEEAEVQAFHARMDKIRPELEKVWTHALNQENLPKTEAMMEVSAGIYLTALQAGQRLSPEQVAELTRLELVEAQRGLIESMEPAHLFQHFPAALQKLDEGLAPEEFEQRFPKLAKRYWGFLAAKVRGNARRGAQPAPAAPSPRPSSQPIPGEGVMDPYLAGKFRPRQG